jgi:NAD(P)H-hydrate epimerase
VLILAGPGNNGGDGLVCARVLHDAAPPQIPYPLTVQVYLLKPRAEDDPVFAPVRERGIFVADAANDMRLRVLHQMITHADVIVDALLGTGVSRPVEGTLRDILGELGGVRKQKEGRSMPLLVALDGVTGMNYDTGALDPSAVPADITVTFHAPKRGHYAFPAAGAGGELVVVPIGVEGIELSHAAPAAADPTLNQTVILADDDYIRARLPTRPRDANKGTFGKVLVIGGCSDYAGAPTLAAMAAYRVGAGLVTLAVPRAVQSSAAVLCREATFVTLPGPTDHFGPEALQRLIASLNGLDVRHAVVLGPGMGQDAETMTFLRELLDQLAHKEGGVRLVVDADALNLLATIPNWPGLLPPQSVLTPHPGEMARLAGVTVKDIQADRIGCALDYAKRWNHVVVLKGAFTVVASPGNGGIVLPYANSAMAVAGMGDVLTGCIAGVLAQGLSPLDAATCGAYVHAGAGERWSDAHGEAGLLASDVLSLLPDTLTVLRKPHTSRHSVKPQANTNE